MPVKNAVSVSCLMPQCLLSERLIATAHSVENRFDRQIEPAVV